MIKIVLLFLFTSFSIARTEVFIDDSLNQQSNLLSIMSEIKNLKDDIYETRSTKQRELDVFYDTSDLNLLNQNSILYYQGIELFNKKNKSTYEENIKFLNYAFEVKHYSNVKSMDEKNPLLFLIKRSDRKLFKIQLQDINIIKPMSIKAVFSLAKIVSTITMLTSNKKSITLTTEQINSSVFLNDITYTVYKVEDHNSSLFAQIKNRLSKFEKLSSESNDYKILYNIAQKKINFLNMKLQYPSVINLFNALLLGLIGLIVIFILIKKGEK